MHTRFAVAAAVAVASVGHRRAPDVLWGYFCLLIQMDPNGKILCLSFFFLVPCFLSRCVLLPAFSLFLLFLPSHNCKLFIVPLEHCSAIIAEFLSFSAVEGNIFLITWPKTVLSCFCCFCWPVPSLFCRLFMTIVNDCISGCWVPGTLLRHNPAYLCTFHTVCLFDEVFTIVSKCFSFGFFKFCTFKEWLNLLASKNPLKLEHFCCCCCGMLMCKVPLQGD